jgi:hypothetical protein
MMGSRGWRGADECDALAHKYRRRVRIPPSIIRAAKRSFWRRTRKKAKQAAILEAGRPLCPGAVCI